MLASKDSYREVLDWPASMEAEASSITRSGLDGEKELDMLFPDLQGLKNTDSPSSSDGHLNGEQSRNCGDNLDLDLLNYLNRENVPASSSHSPPAVPLNKGNNGGTNATIKVVTLKQGFPRGGQILVVEKKKGNTPVYNLTPAMPSVTYDASRGAPLSPSSSNGDTESLNGGQLCMSKNAIAARENRLKKKHNIERLETRVSELTNENSDLKSNLSEMTSSIESLRTEVKYLRSVLANQSTLASLLKRIPNTSGINLTHSGHSTPATSSNVIKRHPSTRKRLASVTIDHDSETDENSEEECDCHPDKNVCMCTKENRHNARGGVSKEQKKKTDHSYANGVNNQVMSTVGGGASQAKRRRSQRSQRRMEETTTAGVCLHVSGESVSLEFCSSCSNNAAHARKTQN